MRKKQTTATADQQEVKAEESAIIAYKGFDKNFKCRDFQFEIGKTYKHKGSIELCVSGFHACLSPLDIQNYYPATSECRYALVEMRGVIEQKENDTKRVCSEIAIIRELTMRELIEAEVVYIAAQATEGGETATGDSSTAASSGNSSTAASSGYSSTAASSGDYSTAASSRNYSKAASSGDSSTAASSGNSSTAASSGDYSTAASSGDSSTAASSGDYSKAASSGNSSKAASSGYSSKAASSGDYSTAASSGHSSTAASSGDFSKAASSGDSSTAASSGNSSTAASSGYSSKAACDTYGFACIAGIKGQVKGKGGSALSLGYQDKEGRNRIAVAYVGENDIEPDTWYRCDNTGMFVKAS